MSLKVTSDSAYRDIQVSNQRIPAISTPDQIPNISLTNNSVSETTAASNQSYNSGNSGNNGNIESDKKSLSNPEKQMQSEISKANSQLKFRGTRCEFKYYDDINRVAIKVLDNETNEVVREIPPEDAIELIQKLWEFAGLMYDEKG
jgi:flagellar protein FlaG